MKVKQYVYFALRSSRIPSAEIERRVGLSPDPPDPGKDAWEIRCDDSRLGIDDQVDRVMARLIPSRLAIRELVSSREVDAVLQVVRYFDSDDGDEEDLASPGEGLEKIPGQHQLLGWHLSREVMAFLLEVGADIDFDEYG